MNDSNDYKVIFHKRPSGRCAMDEFLDELPIKAYIKLMRWIEKLEVMGPSLPRPYADVITGKIRELRMVFSSEQYRCLYFFDGKTIVMTHAFIKKTSDVPPNEILRAENMMKEYFNDKI